MTKFEWGALVYVSWFLLWVVLELVAIYWKGCPWPTLSRTAWDAEDKWSWAQLIFLAGMSILFFHIILGLPKRP